MEIDLSTIPVLQLPRPRQITVRYDRQTRRLHIWGSACNQDMSIVASMIRSGHFRNGVEAVIHTDTGPSGVISIYRAHRLAKWIADDGLCGIVPCNLPKE
jgi:hypothetical protein